MKKYMNDIEEKIENKMDNDMDKKGKTKYSFVDVLDLRNLIVSVESAKNIKDISFCDLVVFPKNRDADIMSEITNIKLSFCDEVVYLDDGEKIDSPDISKFSGMGSFQLFEKDFLNTKIVKVSGCGTLLIGKLSADKDYANLVVSGCGLVICHSSVKTSRLKMNCTGTGSVTYYEGDGEIVEITGNNAILDDETLKRTKDNTIYVVCGGSLTLSDISIERLEEKNIYFIVTGGNIKCKKNIMPYVRANSTIVGGKLIKKLW